MESAPSPNTTGLSIVVNPEDPVLDIAFVHGFTGHPERTWTHKGEVQSQNDQGGHEDGHGERPSKFQKLFNGKVARTSVYWPRDLIPATVKNTARVMTFGYDTNVRHKLGNPINQQTVYDIAYDFLISLEVARRSQPSRPLLFIAHSLGGIIVKETLRRSRGSEFTQTHLRSIYETTSGILFFGTPHSGADPRGPIQHIAEKVIKAAGFSVNKQIVDTLLPSSERLRELRDEFVPMAHQQSWIIYSFQEQYGVSALGGNKVVEDTASCLNNSSLEITQHIASNHMEMCRFNTSEGAGYKKVAGALERILEVASTKRISLGRHVPLDVDQRRIYLNSLDFNQLDARHATIKSAHAKTCRWLLETPQYQNWLDTTKISDHHGFLWIKGKPATGKSTIMKFTYNNAKKTMATTDTVIISFFFNARGDDIEKSTLGTYRSLLFQLLEAIPDLQRVFELIRLRPSNSDGIYQWDIETVKDLFCRAIAYLGKRTLVCFIDALDECDDDQVLDLVKFFELTGERAIASQTRLHVCFSSRHYPHITIEKGIQLILEGEEGHQKDISNYLHSELKAGRSKQIEKIKEEIFERASSIFLWVVLVVKILNSEFRSGRIHALRKRLDEIPDGLDELFSDILTRDAHNMEELILCLQWILFAKRPLKREELYYAILSSPGELIGPWDPDEVGVDDMERFILSSSKGLAGVTKSKNKTVQFIHESVRDYLLVGRGFDTLRADINNLAGQSHDRLKDCCHTYLALDESECVSETLRSLSLASTENFLNLRDLANEKFPFLQYATENILYHADCAHGNGIDQLYYLNEFSNLISRSNWIYLRNLFEKFQIRRYTTNASILYILAEQDLPNLIGVELSKAPHMDIKGERYGFPLLAAIASKCKSAIRAFLTAKSSSLAAGDYEEAFQCVLENRGDITTQRPPQTLLSWAVSNGKYTLAKVILTTEKVEISSHEKVLANLLFQSIKSGWTEIVELLLETENVSYSYRSEDELSRNALSYAAEGGHEAIVKLVLKFNITNVDSRDKESKTPLWYACSRGHESVVRLLLQTGRCDTNCNDIYGLSPLFVAASKGHTEAFRVLLEFGKYQINKINVSSSLLLAAAAGHTEIVSAILESGKYQVNLQDEDRGDTPLSNAAAYGHAEVVRLLLQTGECEPNLKNNDGNSPLLLGVKSKNTEVVRFLLENAKCDVNFQNFNGTTPLLAAVTLRHVRMVELLLYTGKCEVNLKNYRRNTPLSTAVSTQHVEVVRLLLETGKCDVTLRFAVSLEDGEEELRQISQVDTDCVNGQGETALEYAKRKGYSEIVSMFEQYLAHR